MTESEKLLAHFEQAKSELALARAAVESVNASDFAKMDQLAKIAHDPSLEAKALAVRLLAMRLLGQILDQEEHGQ